MTGSLPKKKKNPKTKQTDVRVYNSQGRASECNYYREFRKRGERFLTAIVSQELCEVLSHILLSKQKLGKITTTLNLQMKKLLPRMASYWCVRI